MLNHLQNILCIGMPVADILISGANAATTMQKFNMRPAERNMLQANQIAELESEIANKTHETTIVAGGSLANTACSVAQLCPQQLNFFAVIAADNYGEIFAQGLAKANINHISPITNSSQTSRSYVISDASGERAIARYLGNSMSALTLAHFRQAIDECDLMLLEGELPSLPNGGKLWVELLEYAKKQGKMLGFSLFGAEQVAHHRDLFMSTIEQYADIVFGNEGEVAALFAKPHSNLETSNFVNECEKIFSIMQRRNVNAIMCISHGEGAPYLASRNGVFRNPPPPVNGLVNTLGAGDGFMAGTLSGLLRGMSEEDALNLGHLVAAKVLQQSAPQLSKQTLQAIIA
jgi:sugar/nucleoside kinase (ribokinase family)